MNPSDELKAYERMCRYAAMAERCSWEVERKLHQLKLSDAEITHILARLVSESFIDNARFASAYAHDKFRFNGWGPIRIRQELRLRRIDENIINQAIEELHGLNDNADAVSERLEQLLKRKISSMTEPDTSKRYAKLLRWALSRGFRYEDIRRQLAILLLPIPDED